jgi:prevent-host-death family protein
MSAKARTRDAVPVVQRIPITQARINLGALVRRVRLKKEYVILEKDGIPIAGLMDIDEFEDYLELRDAGVLAHVRESHKEYLGGKSRPAEEFLADLRRQGPGRTARRPRA